ncbi:Crp/Fnr family transcriptional regulator [Piscinibacter sp.]|uniref:Crp/Fnr family transcriptional regulator n=1 Tax=Piscinibacter sp. TaxID=1903157 RepID=UPI002F425981
MTVPPDLNQFIEAAPWRIGLSDAEVERVKQDAFTRSHQAGATVLAHGSPSVHWLGVVAGMLKVDAVSSDGKSTTFAGVSAGAWFGEGAVLKAEPRPYAVVAIRDSTVVFVPRATFMWLIDQSRPFSRWLIEQLNARLGYYVGLVETFRFKEASARVAFCLAEMFNPQLFPGTQARLAISQDEIARLSGLSRQNTNRALHDLELAGLVRIQYGAIEVLDLQGLQAFAKA